MYTPTSIGAGIASGGLAMTGFNVAAYICAGFALIAGGLALLRLMPRRRTSER